MILHVARILGRLAFNEHGCPDYDVLESNLAYNHSFQGQRTLEMSISVTTTKLQSM